MVMPRFLKQVSPEAYQQKLDEIDSDYKEQATAYYKEQRELIDEQKKYSIIIEKHTSSTTRATWVMAIAIIVQCVLAGIAIYLRQ